MLPLIPMLTRAGAMLLAKKYAKKKLKKKILKDPKLKKKMDKIGKKAAKKEAKKKETKKREPKKKDIKKTSDTPKKEVYRGKNYTSEMDEFTRRFYRPVWDFEKGKPKKK